MTEANWSILSLMRFVLAFQVMVFHTGHIVRANQYFIFFGAFAPVAAFFLISGFSIAHSIDSHPQGFYKRRLLRIYPVAAGVAVLSFMVRLAAPDDYREPGGAVWPVPHGTEIVVALFLLNGILAVTPYFIGQYWSLGCEAVYYMLAPLFARLSMMSLGLLIAVSFLCYIVPLAVYHKAHAYSGATHGIAHVEMLWLWLLGFVTYRRRNDMIILPALVIAATAICMNDGAAQGAPALCAVVVLSVWRIDRLRMPRRMIPVANYLGELSYPLYLCHDAMIGLVGLSAPAGPHWMMIVLAWFLSIAGSMAAYHLIDVPIRKRRFHPQPL